MVKMLLGDYLIEKRSFPAAQQVFETFQTKDFLSLIDRKRSEMVNRSLLKLIEAEPLPCFLLGPVLDFVERVNKEQVLEHYTFTSFELWLNQYSGLSFDENYQIRAKIAGKWVHRSDYQILFPIGMGKVYSGTHFVTAHSSPDLDTTVASFWGWMDAFAARVGDGLHIWNLPGGPPASIIEMDWLFRDIFGPAVFDHLAKTRTSLSLNGNDLMTQEGLLRVHMEDSLANIDHEREHLSVIVVDPAGFYLGDWRSVDVEGVRQVVLLFSGCLRWFENQWHLQLISLFAQQELQFSTLEPILKAFFFRKISECEPAIDFPKKQWKEVDDFLRVVLKIEKGLHATFEELGIVLAQWVGVSFDGIPQILHAMKQLFNESGKLLEQRPLIFRFLEQIVSQLHEVILKVRQRMDRMDVALQTKLQVFGHSPTSVTVRSEVEEIRAKMGAYTALTVTYPDEQGRVYPVGVIPASKLRKKTLGTVSLRDFCNREEMTIASYLDVISVIDHHKSTLNTYSPPLAIIADVQSSNSLVANCAFELNDRYSLGGQTEEQIISQIGAIKSSDTIENARLLERLLRRRFAAERKGGYFIHPEREYVEYLQFIYAILDDTDLLSKVSAFDVDCIASLLNRLKSLKEGKEVEVLSLADLPKDALYPKRAAERILQHEEMYSIYRKVYAFKEKEVEKNLCLAAKEQPSNAFSDTKEQNGCCLIGQTKLFASNIPCFEKHKGAIRSVWLHRAQEAFEKNGNITLHMHMISTIVSADEVYHGKEKGYTHLDELWIWAPEEEIAIERLKYFLSAFRLSYDYTTHHMQVDLFDSRAEEFAQIFKESFPELPQRMNKKGAPIVVLRFEASTLNSRKAAIMPYLPVTIA